MEDWYNGKSKPDEDNQKHITHGRLVHYFTKLYRSNSLTTICLCKHNCIQIKHYINKKKRTFHHILETKLVLSWIWVKTKFHQGMSKFLYCLFMWSKSMSYLALPIPSWTGIITKRKTQFIQNKNQIHCTTPLHRSLPAYTNLGNSMTN